MFNIKKITKTLVLATTLTGLMASSSLISELGLGGKAVAQTITWEKEPARSAAAIKLKNSRPKSKSSGFTERVYKILSKASELMEMEPPQYDAAMAALKKQKLNKVTSTERASFYQMMAGIAQNQGKYDEALVYYQNILKEDNIAHAMRDSVTFVVAQLNYQNENYDESLRLLNEWLKYQPNPSVSNMVFIANIYYAKGAADGVSEAVLQQNYRESIGIMNWVIKKSESQNKETKENWYAFLRMLHNSLEEEDRVLELAELLTTRWPKKEYWTQLSGLYAQKASKNGMSGTNVAELEAMQLSAYEMAYRQGMLDKGRELENMSQLFLYHDMPYNSSKILEKSMEEGLSKKTERNYDLLSMGYTNAKDLDKAITPLTAAAVLADNGNLYIRLANVYLALDMYQEAADAIGKGLDKGGVRRPDQSSFLQGQAYMALEKFSDARKSFREAAKDKRSTKAAQSWLKYLVSEEKRIKDIKEYLS